MEEVFWLVNIKEIDIDSSLPAAEKAEQLKKELINPYRFRCGDVIINTKFLDNVLLENSLKSYLLRKINNL